MNPSRDPEKKSSFGIIGTRRYSSFTNTRGSSNLGRNGVSGLPRTICLYLLPVVSRTVGRTNLSLRIRTRSQIGCAKNITLRNGIPRGRGREGNGEHKCSVSNEELCLLRKNTVTYSTTNSSRKKDGYKV